MDPAPQHLDLVVGAPDPVTPAAKTHLAVDLSTPQRPLPPSEGGGEVLRAATVLVGRAGFRRPTPATAQCWERGGSGSGGRWREPARVARRGETMWGQGCLGVFGRALLLSDCVTEQM